MEPRPGDYFVVRTRGAFGFLIRLFTRSNINHAGVYIGEGKTVEAMPFGAEVLTLRKGMVFSNDFPTTDEQRDKVVELAKSCVGKPYGFSDIFALSFSLIGIKPKWLANKIARTDRLICSQLADHCYDQAGIHLFNDGRLPQSVTPEDLSALIMRRDWEGDLTYQGTPVEVDATVKVKESPKPGGIAR